MVLKAKGREKKDLRQVVPIVPPTRTILKTMFFPHLSFFTATPIDCLLGIAENSDLILFRIFLWTQRKIG